MIELHFTNEPVTNIDTFKDMLAKTRQGKILGFWLKGQRYVVQTFESWDTGMQQTNKEVVGTDHPSVRQLGTIKQIPDPDTILPVTAMLTNIQINFKHGERTQVVETWKEVQINKGNHTTIKDPKTFTETHFIPDSPQMDITVMEERESNEQP